MSAPGVTVRILPQFANAVCASVTKAADSGAWPADAGGLLFGTRDGHVITVEAFRRVVLSRQSDTSPDEQFAGRLARLRSAAGTEPELSGLDVVGWCSGRRSKSEGVRERDVKFHNRHFAGAIGLLLIFDPKHREVLVELLAGHSDKAPCGEDHWSSLRLHADTVFTSPIEMQVASRSDGDDASNRLASSPAESVAAAQPKPEPLVDFRPDAAEQPPHSPAIAVGSKTKLILSTLAGTLLLVCASIMLAWVHQRAQHSTPTRDPGALRARIASGQALQMQVEPRGDAILLGWNREAPAVQHAKQGILQIDDGGLHRTVYLDSNEVARGSIVYRPASSDVKFHLEIGGNRGSTLSDEVRVLYGVRGAPEPASIADSDVPEPRGDAPPRPVKQILPDSSAFSVTSVHEGTEVRVRVHIDEEGRVIEARVLNGVEDDATIRKAALEAAKQWLFAPATSGGKSVPSDHVIAFKFHS